VGGVREVFWWWRWFTYLLNTTWHFINRRAYHAWCERRYGYPSGRIATMKKRENMLAQLFENLAADDQS